MKKKLFIGVLTCLMLILAILPVSAAASGTAVSNSQDGLTLTVNTDKDDYKSDETASVTVTVTNTNSYDIFIVKRELILPDGMSIITAEGAPTATVHAGESLVFPYTVKLAADGSPNQSGSSPKTGDNNNMAIWIILILLSAGALVSLGKKYGFRKSSVKALSVLLCFAMLLPMLSGFSAFAVGDEKTVSVTKTITVDGVSKNITARITYTANIDPVTVSFETNGGSDVSPVTLNKGELLSALPMPAMEDYAFTGWFTDNGLNDPFYSDDPVVKNMTLYARYAERDNNVQEYIEPNKYIEDCPADFTVTVLSPVALTTANMAQYIDLTLDSPGDTPNVTVSGSGEKYTIAPVQSYQAGRLYRLTLKNDNLFFEGEDEGVRELSFRIHREESDTVEFLDGIIDVLRSEATDLGEGAYTVPADKYSQIKTAFDANSAYNQSKNDQEEPDKSVILRFWNGTFDGGNVEYRKVTMVTLTKDNENKDILLLHTDECRPGEIYDEVDVYGEQLLDPGILFEAAMRMDTDLIAHNVKNGAGAAQIADMLKNAVSQSPTIKALAENSGEMSADKISIYGDDLAAMSGIFPDSQYFGTPTEGATKVNIPTNFIDVEGLQVTCTVGGSNNGNFPVGSHVTREEWAAQYPHLANEYPNIWPVLTLKFEYNMVVKNKIEVKAVFEIKEYLTAALQGWCEYGGDKWHPSTWDNLSFDYALNVYSQSDLSLSVLVKSVDKSDEFEYDIDVTEEIGKLLNSDKSDDGDPAAILEKVLGDKGDYIDIVEAKIVEVTVSIYKLIDLDFELSFVVRVNFAAGISSRFSYLCAQQFGVTGNLDTLEANTYKNVLDNNGAFRFDLYAAGYLGVKVGLRGGVFVSVVGLKDVGRVGMTLEVGAYMDIYGFIHVNIVKPGDIYRTSSGWHGVGDKTTKISVQGAVYMELGIYVEMAIVLESKIFRAKLSVPIFEFKIPIFTMGERYVLSKFTNNDDKAAMTGDSLPLLGSGGLLEAEYIDMKTGKKVTGNYASLNRFALQFSSRAFKVEGNNIVIDKTLIGTNSRLDDSAVAVYYTGGCLSFGLQTNSVDLGGYQEKRTLFPKAVQDLLDAAKGYETFKKMGLMEGQTKEEFMQQVILPELLKEETLKKVHEAGFIKRNGITYSANGQYGEDFVPLTVDEYTALMTRYTNGDLALEEDYNKFNRTTTRAKLIWLVWIDTSIFEGSEIADFYKPVKATYVLDINGVTSFLTEKNVLPGNKPGVPDIGSDPNWNWYTIIEAEKNVKVIRHDDFNQPIIKDTVYTVYAETPQRLVTFVTLYDGKYHYDVYAVNVGDVPTPPAGYDSSLNFISWISGGNSLNKTNGLVPVSWDYRYISQTVYTGLDTTQPLFSVSGDATYCRSEYINADFQDGLKIYQASQYLYEAQYDRPVHKVTVTWNDLQYLDDSNHRAPVTYEIPYGNPLYLNGEYFDGERGVLYAGIDINGDGIADYDRNFTWSDWLKNPPLISGDMTITILREVKTNNFIVQDYDGNTVNTFSLNYGNTPGTVNTAPEYPNPYYTFDHWKVSKDGGAFKSITSYGGGWGLQMGFYTDDGSNDNVTFTLRPAAREAGKYSVWFADGTGGSVRLELPQGTFNVSDFPDLASASRASDERYDYTFTGWECGATFTVRDTSEQQIILAKFTPTPAVYTINFSTPHGTLSTGGGDHSILSTYDGYEAAAAAFIALNNALGKTYTTESVYTFDGWFLGGLDTAKRTANYYARWLAAPREYTITFKGGDGTVLDGDAEYSSSRQYGLTTTLPAAGVAERAEDNYNTYTHTGWKDVSGTEYDPGAEYTVTGDMTFTAVYTATPKVYTVTVTSGDGKFADGTTVNKVYTGGYNQATNIGDIGTPAIEATVQYTYTFSGWSSPLPSVFTENITITAQFTQALREYTITFNAGDGLFDGGESVYRKSFPYGSAISGIPVPVKGAEGIYSYSFSGWSPTPENVTGEASYDAQYARVKTGMLPTGIKISDGSTIEDITEGTIPGYQYELIETYPESNMFIPTLTVTGNGLTVSGAVDYVYYRTEDTVRIFIDGGVTDVCFEDLSLSGAFYEDPTGVYETTLSVIDLKSGIGTLTLTIAGDCVFEKEIGGYVIHGERAVLITGKDQTASLTLTAMDAQDHAAFYFNNDVTIKDVRLYASSSYSNLVRNGNLIITGDAIVELISRNNTINVLYVSGISDGSWLDYTGGYLIFDDFTGSFKVRFDNPNLDPDTSIPAVYVLGHLWRSVSDPNIVDKKGGVRFIIDGEEVLPEDYGVTVVEVTPEGGRYSIILEQIAGNSQDITVEFQMFAGIFGAPFNAPENYVPVPAAALPVGIKEREGEEDA